MNEIFDWEQVPEPPAPPPYDDDCSIFPPSSHEGLHVEDFLPESSRSSVPEGRAADRPPQLSVLRLPVTGESTKQRLLLGFQALYSKLLFLLRADALSFPIWKANWSRPAAVGGVAGVLFLWWLRRRRVALANDDETVIFLIRQNEKKIDQLLQQVGQMKEIISAQHKVPILRSA